MVKQNTIVNLFVPCCMDLFVPQTPYTIINILKQLDIYCHYEPEATCCGREFYVRGEMDIAKELAYNYINYFHAKQIGVDRLEAHPIIIPSADCAAYIKKSLPELCSTMALPAEIKYFIQHTYELCDYLVNVARITTLNNSFPHRVFYFESCAARNYYQLGDEVQTLLSNTEGLTLFTDPEMKLCCSAHGSFAMHNGELSEYLLKMIVDRIMENDIEYITSTDTHCLQFIDAYLQTRQDLSVEVIPIPEILNAHK